MQKEIVVVTTTDAKYLLNCYVSIFSIIKAANPMDIYKIFVLTEGLAEKDCEKLEKLSMDRHVFVKCINISEITKDFDLRETELFPVSIYYRLFIPLILPEYKKVLYLDADICVLHDIAELYNSDLEGHVMGAVHDVPCGHLDMHDREIGGLDCRKTFNSGVLLIDTEAFETEQIREKCMALLLEDYKGEKRKLIYPDNDALNIVLYDKCRILDDAWNFQVQHMWKMEEMFEEYRSLYQRTSRQPYIVHYTGEFKPWTDPDRPMADIFWRLASEAGVRDEIVFQQLIDARNLKNKMKNCSVFLFPYPLIPYGSRIAIYAAGMVGQAFYDLMQMSHYAQVVLWVDRNYERLSDRLPVEAPYSLLMCKEDYQYLVIAIEKKETADEVLEELHQHGIPKRKMIWAQYKNESQD